MTGRRVLRLTLVQQLANDNHSRQLSPRAGHVSLGRARAPRGKHHLPSPDRAAGTGTMWVITGTPSRRAGREPAAPVAPAAPAPGRGRAGAAAGGGQGEGPVVD